MPMMDPQQLGLAVTPIHGAEYKLNLRTMLNVIRCRGIEGALLLPPAEPLALDGDGVPIDAAARYRLDPEHGPRRLLSDRGRSEREDAATGRALLALGEDRLPDEDDLAGLRRALRPVLAHHLGGRGLKSWELMGELGRLARSASEGMLDR